MIKMYCKVEEIYNYTHHEKNKDKLTIHYDVDEKFKKLFRKK